MDTDKDLKKDNLTDDQEDAYLDAIADEEKKSDSESELKSEDAAVDAVVKDESDRLLQSDDEALERRSEPRPKKSLKEKLKAAAVYWWDHKKLRYATFIILFLAVTAAIFVPTSRYFVLNTAGVRVRTSLSVVDSQTGLPLKNIPIRLQGQEIRSDDNGEVVFYDLKLGRSQLIIDKLGYSYIDRMLTLGWGSNPLGDQPMTATGSQFTFVLGDWLSNQSITGAEARSGEDVAKADKDGRIVLTVGEINDQTEAVIDADGYREEKIPLADIREEKKLSLVPAKKHVFVSNRDGKYDLYKIDVDGQNEEILLEATGKEREIPHVQPHPTKEIAAFISTRDGDINSGGFVLDGLFIVDVESGAHERITRSEQVQLIGWVGDKLVYSAIVEGVSGSNPERSKLFSYDTETGEKTTLAVSNYFNDISLVGERVYYSVSAYGVPKSAAKLFSVNLDGSDKQTEIDMQVWDIVQASFNTLNFRAVNDAFETVWFTQKTGGDVEQLEAPPVTQTPRNYTLSPDGARAIWVDQRDGKGVLLSYDVKDDAEAVVQTAAGLSDPTYWANNSTVIYRIATNQEIADYVLNLDGGEARKVTDVVGNRSRYFY